MMQAHPSYSENQHHPDEEGLHRISKMFDMMQVPILKYMMYLIQESGYGTPEEYEKIFDLPPISEMYEMPIVLQNIDEFGNKFIYVTFEIIEVNELRSNNYHTYIPDETMWDYITELVNNGANMIWDYFLAEKIISNPNLEFLKKVKITLDADNLTFTPTVSSSTQQVLLVLYDILQSITSYKNNVDPNTNMMMYHMLPEEKRNEIEATEKKIIGDIATLEKKLSEEEESDCIQIENRLKSMKLLVAQCSIVDKSGLPIEMQNVLTAHGD